MTERSFRRRIRSAPPPIGTMVTLDSAEVVEALALCGFDWLFIDMEHGPLDLGATQRLVRAAGERCLTLVRVPENSASWIRRVLDTGCDGVIVPQVCSAEEARRAAEAARYPPAGTRGAGVARAHGYGLQFAEYVAGANEQVSVIIQIEHVAAVDRIDEILATPGIDAVLIGPYDLSGSMGLLGQVQHPAVQETIGRIRAACARHEMPTGIFVLAPDAAPAELAQGVNFLAIGTDLSFLTATARSALALVRPAAG